MINIIIDRNIIVLLYQYQNIIKIVIIVDIEIINNFNRY
jgi:hypothetical protein